MKKPAPHTKNFKKFVDYLLDWMDSSTNAREMVFEVSEGELSFRDFVEAYDDMEEFELVNAYTIMRDTLKYFGAKETKRACKRAAHKYELQCY